MILGTLGRQGNSQLFERVRLILERSGKAVVQFLMAEIMPAKLALIGGIDVSNRPHCVTLLSFLCYGCCSCSPHVGAQAWVQVACPRLSIDWGTGFEKVSEAFFPLLLLWRRTNRVFARCFLLCSRC